MPVNKENNNVRPGFAGAFDKTLSRALQNHSEAVPAAFTERILEQIKQAEEQRILARVVMQERLALAGCVVLGILTVASLFIFPDITSGAKEVLWNYIYKAARVAEIADYKWYLFTVCAGLFGLFFNTFIDLLVGEK